MFRELLEKTKFVIWDNITCLARCTIRLNNLAKFVNHKSNAWCCNTNAYIWYYYGKRTVWIYVYRHNHITLIIVWWWTMHAGCIFFFTTKSLFFETVQLLTLHFINLSQNSFSLTTEIKENKTYTYDFVYVNINVALFRLWNRRHHQLLHHHLMHLSVLHHHQLHHFWN